ncbi:YdcF family protein [Jannaschia marina]|uniref:YdcF family protein n=1 Tax=Jannaschia marina TaxID=2741674 RepID=UPI0015C81919|nr:YdcF family protein [Jannaschia marina]
MTTAIVLGAAVRPDGTPSPTLALRVDHAVTLWRTGRAERICLTGGIGRHGPSEARVARDRAHAAGIPEAALLLEEASTTTLENIAFAAPLCAAPLILVTNRWHLPRALMIARLLGLGATGSGPRATAPVQTTTAAILREVAAAPVSAVRAVRWARRTAR